MFGRRARNYFYRELKNLLELDKWEYNNNGGNQIFLMRTVKKDKNGLVGENEWDCPNAVFVDWARTDWFGKMD